MPLCSHDIDNMLHYADKWTQARRVIYSTLNILGVQQARSRVVLTLPSCHRTTQRAGASTLPVYVIVNSVAVKILYACMYGRVPEKVPLEEEGMRISIAMFIGLMINFQGQQGP